jgi:hypothetical protein
MTEVPTGAQLEGAITGWLQLYDPDEHRGNDDDLREMLADTLGDDSGEAVVKSAQLVSLENVEESGEDFRTLAMFNMQTEHRTNSDDPDTFGPDDLTEWKVELAISAVHEEGEWRATDVTVAPG